MKNSKKLLIFCMIMFISIGGLFVKGYFDDEMYVLNDKEETTLELEDKEDNKLEKTEVEENKEDDDNCDEGISKKKITVYISGEIKNPGVVTLDSDKRLSDAVNILGGLTEKADMNEINLAMKLEDEMHCIIPKKGSKKSNITSKESNDDKVDKVNQANSNKININQAGISELDAIPGVGEATANKILNYRNENGSFKSIEEIKNVSGIGEKKFANMKDYICTN